MDDTNKTCREFVAALASSAPTPGGGGAAALCGAVGAALCGMVASLTTGKKKYADVESEIQQLLKSTNTLHDKLLDQVRADAEGFQPLSRAYAIPREDPTRAAVLASGEPTPGGGGAAALCGAVGAALCGMVASLTTGRKRYEAVETEIQQLLKRTNALQGELLEQAAADAEGFLPLRRAYGIPKDDPARESVMQHAAEAACAEPLLIMELCADALDAAGRLADIGSRLAVSDAGCAAAILKGALEAASLNVLVNTKTMTDRAAAQRLNERCFALLERGAEGERIFRAVREQLT